LRNNK